MSENYIEMSANKKKEIDSDIGDYVNLKKISALRAAKYIMLLTEKLFLKEQKQKQKQMPEIENKGFQEIKKPILKIEIKGLQ